ncbi:MAG TPA: glycosyl hydrolase family 28-related protein [Verrucomicrobiae bacterium]|nr:glycosyl hydrolase family 28-related protein [Verrucomicrobiae bacterium]
MMKRASTILATLMIAIPLHAASYYTVRPEDPKAVYFTRDNFPVHADGVGDDSDSLQRAINQVQETVHKGIVFIPEGQYRLGKTVYVWSGIRLIGYGGRRPVFILGENTSGFQEGSGNYMIHFVSDRPAEGRPIRDANPGTFYSAMSNIDIEIRDGNRAAIGVRSHFAQHCFLAHMDFRVGSGKAGVEEVGNESEDLRFFGGEFGVTMHKPSPSWPFLLIDSSFEGQRKAAIETEEGGLTIIRNQFKNVPTAIAIRENRAEELWIKDSRFEDITGPALIISEERNARTQVNLANVVCQRVPALARFREIGGELFGRYPVYEVKSFTHGLQIDDLGALPQLGTDYEIAQLKSAPEPVQSDVPSLPPAETWVNVRSLGAKGDGVTDDTAVIQEAIAKHRAIYLPSGRYRVTDTIALRPDTVLIGLHPYATQIVVLDSTPAFDGIGAPKPLLETPQGGTNIITGIGLDTGLNRRAVAVKWMAGKDSMLNDVRFLGGHGMYNPDGTRLQVYNNNRTGDPDPKRRWDSQYWSLWITDGGGGTFKDIWTPNTFAQAGVYISDTTTEGRIYAMSSEHHVRNEVKLRNVSNWQLYGLQTEEERGEGPNCLPVDIDNCSNITFANLYLYRVTSTYSPFPYAVKIRASRDLRFRNVHVYSPSKFAFDNAIYDQTHETQIRTREIASLNVSGAPPKSQPPHVSSVLAAEAKVEKLVGGFNNIDAATVDAMGNVYFIDARFHRIYRWSAESHDLTVIRDSPLEPAGLAFDKSGNLLVVTRVGAVYAFRPDSREGDITVLQPAPAAPRPGLTAILPVSRWRDAHDFIDVNTKAAPLQYLSLDERVFIPATDDFKRADSMRSFSMVDLVRAYGLAAASTNHPFYVADEFGQKTWAFTVNPDGSLSNPKRFAEEGEAGVTTDVKGNVYVAAGDIFVYDPSGKQIDLIEVPERPTSLVFGGKDRQTLFIAARGSLYMVRTKYGGQ